MTVTPELTRTAPARLPDGFPFGRRRYSSHILFAGTGVFMLVGAGLLMAGLLALGRGEEAWQRYLAWLASPAALLLTLLVLINTVYFAIRFAWVGRKIATGKVHGLRLAPELSLPALGGLTIGGLVLVWLLVLFFLGGFLP